MNHTFRIVFNAITGAWVAVAETAKARGKASRCARPLAPLLALALGSPTLAAPPAATELPTGGQVVAGQASLSQSGAAMTVTQTSNRAVIDWQTFNVGSQARVDFVQHSAAAVTLNRVLDTQPSQIFGSIKANGQVFLTNPNGVYFAPSASVDVGGLVATTHTLSTDDFMAGNNIFRRHGSSAALINEGSLQAGIDGYIALLAPEVRNQGVIVAQAGTVVLAAGEVVTLQLAGAATRVFVEPSEIAALVDNRQAVLAPGGQIILSALAANRLQGGVVRNSGSLEAVGLVSDGGRIELIASDEIDHSGRIAADAAPGSAGRGGTVTLIADLENPGSITRMDGSISARGGDAGGKGGGEGGFVETSGSRVRIGDGIQMDTRAPQGRTGTWLIDPDGFTIAASGGDISGTALSATLATTSFEIVSTPGSDGNIHVNDAVSWSSNTLTLRATNDVRINAVMTASGEASLNLEPGSGKVLMGFDAEGNFAGRVDFPGRSGTGFLTINGLPYTVINALGAQGSLTGLDLQGVNGNLGGRYALGGDIDASTTSDWNGGAGFQPLGGRRNPFTGKFDGLGHTITGLTINFPQTIGVGLFGSTSSSSSLRNVGLVGGSVTGRGFVGGLVGENYGKIDNSFAKVDASGLDSVGGLVGINYDAPINNSYATGNVSSGAGSNAGGLVGNNNGPISDSYATGKVYGNGLVGGLAGYNYGPISNSYATGNVTSDDFAVGGLVGLNYSQITNSHASGSVTGHDSFIGGLVGDNEGATISNSYATGSVIGTGNKYGPSSYLGGLAGYSSGAITSAYASGSVTGPGDYVGGLLGYNDKGTITDAYAIGSVAGAGFVGGLAGYNLGTITRTYAAGSVSGTGRYIGGLIGSSSPFSSVSGSFWDSEVNSGLSGVGNGSSDGVIGLGTADMQNQANFVAADWNFSTPVWKILSGANGGYPCLSFAPNCVASVAPPEPPVRPEVPTSTERQAPLVLPPTLATSLPDRAPVLDVTPAASLTLASTADGEGAGAPAQSGTAPDRFTAFLAAEIGRRNARTELYREALDLIRRNPAAADIPACTQTASEVCVPERIDSLAVAKGSGRKTALLFGNNAYSGNIPALQTPVGDVESVGGLLRERLGYEVEVVPNAGKREMILALKRLAETAGPNDNIVVMYAGHGYELDDTRQGFWLPVDANETNPETWISNGDIARLLNANPARQILLVSDSCFSGTLTKEAKVESRGESAEEILLRRSVLALSSGGEEPVSDDGLGGHSIFAHHLIGALAQVDRQSTATQIHMAVKEEVEKDFPQEPQLGGLLSAGHTPGGDFLFRKN
ncbi:GLUG motif-containing protein [Rhodocyclus purpureus]|uniref:two-partner secretion domain-containing protein n=1 Tax=Rhodocyclus purpureus TaxID=1067 RepID=UPI0019115DBD|nr:GLUG motif-containing protein [Rhodocyclus purpureus]MBK5913729.1 hypothetical protein [Rhodocyclus purpureus]